MRLAVIPGDGIGPEVIGEALKVLGEVAPNAETTNYDLGAARWHATGELLPESVLTELRQHDGCAYGSSSTTTSTCGRPSSTPACAARWPIRPRSTW